MGGGGGIIGKVTGGIGKALGAVTGGGVGSALGGVALGPLGALGGGFLGAKAGLGLAGGSSGGPNVPQVGGQQTPLQMLTMSGGAPLLTNIALGADVGTSIMGYFGASGDYNTWYNNLNPQDQQAIKGLHDQLSQVQQNTDMRNQAVQKLADDFPNLMAAKIPQYSSMADSATQDMMTKAMNQISAKQAAGGAFSSGATAAAAARAGADIGMQKLQYGTGMALQDFQQQYNQAAGLQNFQQKMLGQGATQGFNAVQNALSRNAGIAGQQATLQAGSNNASYQSQQGMFGALGGLAGMGIGSMLMGPTGAAIGGQVGQSAFPQGEPLLNMPLSSKMGNGQYGGLRPLII